jgi:hypothetical protein
MASKKKRSTKVKTKRAAKPKRAAGKAGKQRSCPHCGKVGFNSRSHPKHLPRGERGK